MPRNHPRQATTTKAARRDREFAKHQAQELRKMRDAQRRVKDLARSLARITRAADLARIEAARYVVEGSPFMLVTAAEWGAVTKRADMATARVAKLEAEFEKLTGVPAAAAV